MKILQNILILLFLWLIVSHTTLAQVATATMDDHEVTGSTVTVPVDVTDFNDLGAITLFIDYDPAVVNYNSFQNPALSGMMVNTLYEGRIGISWIGTNPGTNVNGTLIELVFDFISGSTPLEFFEEQCEISNNSGNPISVIYTDGSITGPGNVSVSLEDQLNQTPNTQISVPMNVDFSEPTSGVGSFQFVIEFDGDVLEFNGLTNETVSGITTNVTSNPTALIIGWSDAANPVDLNGTLLDINFNYSYGSSGLVFDEAASTVSDNNLTELAVDYANAQVTQDPGTAMTLSLSSLELPAGAEAEVPLTVTDFTDVGSFQLYIEHDDQVAEYVELRNVNAEISESSLVINEQGGTLMIGYANAAAPITIPDTEKLFDIVYAFGSGTTSLAFDEANTEIADSEGNPFSALYNDGELTESVSFDSKTSIDSVSGQPGNSVNVPLNIEKYENIGAITYQIVFDRSVMTFSQLSNISSELQNNGLLEAHAVDGELNIVWKVDGSGGHGVDFTDGKLFDLTFDYVDGTSDVMFLTEKCDVATYDHQTVNVSYSDGQVSNQSVLTVKCYLEGLYNASGGRMNKAKDFVDGAIVDKFEGEVADLIDIELHDATSYGTVIFSEENVELNQDGTASVSIPSQYDGQYYITIKHRNHIETVSANAVDFSNGVIDYDFTTGASQAYGNNMTEVETGVYGFYGGDVNQDGAVTGVDLVSATDDVRTLISGYVPTDFDGNGSLTGIDLVRITDNIRLLISKQIP